ncbi:hypothetical protein [Sporosarcina sp. HYO08]|uniref:hypothetical protein n=1 Tax=Sporosarcina sp. HYO08 TaxID=1759557 RepID=UPI0007937D09|nr:hypothetical protein [Sporosarcina sp. HYO08]KXH87059.1 hypothetical protein AU377_00315 [Sporosarcina sp. HYO08]
MKQMIGGGILFLLLGIPFTIVFLESMMVIHMLVQIPLLILAGWLMGAGVLQKFPRFFANWNGNGVSGILLVSIILMYWMLPRAMDEALLGGWIELFKFISLPVAGLFIRDSWTKLKTNGKSFVFLNFLSMFGLMGWLYMDAPIQLCNNYLELEQKALGWGFLAITLAMILYLLQNVFMDHSGREHEPL